MAKKKISKQDKLKKQRERNFKKKQIQQIKIKENLLCSHREEYAQNWSRANASLFEDNGLYEWMANFLDNYGKIIEIGTGDGRGTLALARRGHQVISIDENQFCLEMAYDLLSKQELTVFYLQRENITFKNHCYCIEYDDIDIDLNKYNVILINGDILNDEKLNNWLLSSSPYDAIACWLIGTHSSRQSNEKIQDFGINSSQDYRLKTQNTIYEIADKLLRSGGLLHIVDRGEVPDTKLLQDDFINSHNDQATVTSLVVNDLNWVEYQEPDSPDAIKMVVATPLSGRTPNLNKIALQSITATKP